MNELERRIAIRHDKRYGNLDVNKQLAKLLEEAGELARGILRQDFDNAKEELGDVVVVLSSIARYLGTDLTTVTADSISKHEKRLAAWERKQIS